MQVSARMHACAKYSKSFTFIANCIKGNSSQYKGVKKEEEKRTWILETNSSWCEQNVYQTPVIPPDIRLSPPLPPPWLLHFLCPPAHYCCRRSFAVITGEEKARSGLRLSFASCYHFFHPYPLPNLGYSDSLPPPFLPLTYSNWSRVEWVSRDEGGTHARRWTFDPSTQWPCLCRLGSNSDIQLCFSLDNKTSLPGPE